MGLLLLLLVVGVLIGGLVLLLAAGVAAGVGASSGSGSTYARQRVRWGGVTLVVGLALLGALLIANAASGGCVAFFAGFG